MAMSFWLLELELLEPLLLELELELELELLDPLLLELEFELPELAFESALSAVLEYPDRSSAAPPWSPGMIVVTANAATTTMATAAAAMPTISPVFFWSFFGAKAVAVVTPGGGEASAGGTGAMSWGGWAWTSTRVLIAP